jgi:hypothetical protein
VNCEVSAWISSSAGSENLLKKLPFFITMLRRK